MFDILPALTINSFVLLSLNIDVEAKCHKFISFGYTLVLKIPKFSKSFQLVFNICVTGKHMSYTSKINMKFSCDQCEHQSRTKGQLEQHHSSQHMDIKYWPELFCLFLGRKP